MAFDHNCTNFTKTTFCLFSGPFHYKGLSKNSVWPKSMIKTTVESELVPWPSQNCGHWQGPW